MGRIREKLDVKRSSPSHSFSSSSSSDFEFTVVSSSSPRKSSPPLHRTADELFYKGQLLPLHLSPRLSMVRTLLLLPSSPSSTSSSSYASSDTTASRASTASTSSSSRDSCDSSARPSSVLEDFNEFKRLNNTKYIPNSSNDVVVVNVDKKVVENNLEIKKNINNNYFSLARLTSVFKKDPTTTKQPSRIIAVDVSEDQNVDVSGVKRASNAAMEVIRKYMKKVKPLYEKLSQKQQKMSPEIINNSEKVLSSGTDHEMATGKGIERRDSFSGNLKYPRRRVCVAASCPSSIDSSPNHWGVLSRTGLTGSRSRSNNTTSMMSYSTVDRSSMDELQSAIQGAIAHCKNSMV